MIHVLDNGKDCSDHRTLFIEHDLSGPQLALALEFVSTFTDDHTECWTCGAIWTRMVLVASGTLTFFSGKPGTLEEALDIRSMWCNHHIGMFEAKIAELRRVP